MTSESEPPENTLTPSDLQQIAAHFVAARRAALPLADYPGPVPANLATAYSIQDLAIDQWPDEIGGWKVGRIPPAVEDDFGCDRLAGPIFKGTIHYEENGKAVAMPVIAGGFGAIEAEYVAIIAKDAPEDKISWSIEEAKSMIGDLRIGLEVAASPLKTINDLGPAVVASDFGNNAGLIVGPSIRDWQSRALESLACESFIEGASVGSGGAFLLTGGYLRSVQFILSLAAQRGRALKAGDVIATGQTNGIHDVLPHQNTRIEFAGDGAIECRIEAAAAAD